MNKKVYIDQNILGLMKGGKIGLFAEKNVDWIFSKEHFKEMIGMNDVSKFHQMLDYLKAQIVDVVGEDDKPVFRQYAPVEKFYEEFLNEQDIMPGADEFIRMTRLKMMGVDVKEQIFAATDSLETELEEALKEIEKAYKE